ncbi:MAG: hypothetical protein Q7U91_13675 [Sideroxyarcus sp.]|nr:hypothetical protein [Sideroxyarcus sp.]
MERMTRSIAALASVLGIMAGAVAMPENNLNPVPLAIDFSFDLPFGVASDKAGNIYVADLGPDKVYRISPARKVDILSDKLYRPLHVATDAAGNIYLSNGGTIQKIEPSGVVTTLIESDNKVGSVNRTFRSIGGMAIDKAGNIYVTDVDTVSKISPSGKMLTLIVAPRSQSHTFRGIAVDGVNNIYFADEYNHTIHKITPAGAMTTLAGATGQIGDADGAGGEARFNGPWGVATDSTGNVYVADTRNGSIRRITPAGTVSTLAGTAEALGQPVDLALDQTGNIYLADIGTQTIYKISPTEKISVFAGKPDEYGHRNPSLCRFNERTYFSCSVKGGKTVSVCGSRIINESRGYLQYRFGKRGAIELALPETLEHPSKLFTQTNDKEMRIQSATLTIKKGLFAYTAYSTQGIGSDLPNGVFVTKNNKKVADMPCTENVVEGDMFFDEAVIKRNTE